MKTLIAAVTFTLAANAHADTTSTPPAGTVEGGLPATTKPGTVWLGGDAALASPSSDGLNGMGKPNFDMAYALTATLDYQLSPLVSLRAMPRYVTNLKASMDKDSSSAYDIRGGVTLGTDVAPKIRIYGLGALGYSSISFPSSTGLDSASGATLTLGGGGTYTITPTIRLYAEASYEAGFQSVSVMGQSADYKLNFLDFGAGVQVAVR
jgi:hypothetical protein